MALMQQQDPSERRAITSRTSLTGQSRVRSFARSRRLRPRLEFRKLLIGTQPVVIQDIARLNRMRRFCKSVQVNNYDFGVLGDIAFPAHSVMLRPHDRFIDLLGELIGWNLDPFWWENLV